MKMLSPGPSKDMQTPPSPSLRSGHISMKDADSAESNDIFFNQMDKFMENFFYKSGQIYMKDAKCAETNEKSIFRTLVFEI